MDLTPYYPWIFLLAIAGVSMAVYRLKAGHDEEREDKQTKENAQDRLFEAGKELEGVSALLTNNKLKEACNQFVLTSEKIDKFSLRDFSTLEWKTYFEQVKVSKTELGDYIFTNCIEEYEGVFAEKQEAEKAKTEKNDKDLYITSLIFFGVIFLLGILIAIYHKP